MGKTRSDAMREASKYYKEQEKENLYLNKQFERLGLSAPPERYERVGRYGKRETEEYKKWFKEYSAKVKETIGMTPEQARARNKYGVRFDPNGNMILRDGKPDYVRKGMARIPQQPDIYNAVQQELYYYDRKQAAKKRAEEMYNKKILEGKTLLAQQQSEGIKAKEAAQKSLLGAIQGAALGAAFKEAVRRRKDKSMYRKNKNILGGSERLNDKETLG